MCALPASGTATLETTMMEFPQCYCTVSPITYGIGKMVVNVSHVILCFKAAKSFGGFHSAQS